ncbi:MAG: LysR family transcriptional regulator [Sarcina sp.]
MLNFKDLKYLKSLSETNSFTKTAQEFYVSQPTITNAIKNLEYYFEIKLVNREKFKKAISFTSEGKELIEIIDFIEILLKDFKEKVHLNEKKNEIIIGIPPIVDNIILKNLLFEIFNINTINESEILLKEHYMIDLHKMLQEKTIDLIIGYYLGKKNYIPNIKSIYLTSLNINFYEKKDEFSNEKTFNPNQLKDKSIVSLNKPSIHSLLIEKVLNYYNITPKEIIFVKDFNICETLIENGLAVSIFGEGSCSGNSNISSKPMNNSITIDLFLEYNYLNTLPNIVNKFLGNIKTATPNVNINEEFFNI